jgi:hypothetical protein
MQWPAGKAIQRKYFIPNLTALVQEDKMYQYGSSHSVQNLTEFPVL